MIKFQSSWPVDIKTLSNFFDSDKYSSIIIRCDDSQKIKCHKVILSSASEYFDIIFQYNSFETEIPVSGVPYAVLVSVIKWIYTGEITFPINKIDDILSCGKLFMLNHLVGLCDVIMVDHVKMIGTPNSILERSFDMLTSEMLIYIVLLSYTYDLAYCYVYSVLSIRNNIRIIKFTTLPLKVLKDIINTDYFNISHMEVKKIIDDWNVDKITTCSMSNRITIHVYDNGKHSKLSCDGLKEGFYQIRHYSRSFVLTYKLFTIYCKNIITLKTLETPKSKDIEIIHYPWKEKIISVTGYGKYIYVLMYIKDHRPVLLQFYFKHRAIRKRKHVYNKRDEDINVLPYITAINKTVYLISDGTVTLAPNNKYDKLLLTGYDFETNTSLSAIPLLNRENHLMCTDLCTADNTIFAIIKRKPEYIALYSQAYNNTLLQIDANGNLISMIILDVETKITSALNTLYIIEIRENRVTVKTHQMVIIGEYEYHYTTGDICITVIPQIK